MPRWTLDELRAYEARNAAGTGYRSGTGIQEQQAADSGQAGDETRVPEVDEEVRGRFRISVDLYYQDRRRRDVDGAASTLADIIVATRRRLLGASGMGLHSGKSGKRPK